MAKPTTEEFKAAEQRMFEAYIDCALWSSSCSPEEIPLDEDYGIEDIAVSSLLELREEVHDFLEANWEDLKRHGTWDQCGHDFWLTRNGHGAGFWDRGTGPVGDRLSEAARVYGEVDLYVGDDSLIYCS